SGFPDQGSSSCRRSTSSQQIIHKHDSLARCHRVRMHFHFRLAVLQRILGGRCRVREFAALADRNETKAKFVCHSRSEKKTTCLHPDDLIDIFSPTALQEQIKRRPEQESVAQDRRNVLKHDAFFWKIPHVAYGGMELFDELRWHRRER